MTILRAAVVLLFVTACLHRGYVPAGAPPAFNASGFYAMGEELYSSDCGPVATRAEPVRVEVQHPAGSTFGKFIVNARVYDMQIRSDGSFTVRQAETGSQAVNSTSIAGRFSDGGFYARVSVTTAVPRALRDARPTSCTYQLRWTGKKL